LTRNDVDGFEIHQTSGTEWVKVDAPGFTDVNSKYGWIKPGPLGFSDFYDSKHNLKQNIWGDMIAFKGHLYVTVESGYQGAHLYGSQGLQIWRFDGTSWESVISPVADYSGEITSTANCGDGDGNINGTIIDSEAAWSVDSNWGTELEGCILRIEADFDGSLGTIAGTPGMRVFEIGANTDTMLGIRQNEVAHPDDEYADEYAVCAEQLIVGDIGRANYVIPKVDVGDSYIIDCGATTDSLANMWNKSIVDFETLNGELYATIGLNYEDGARVWETSDGMNWEPVSDYSFGSYHGYEPDGTPILTKEDCPLLPSTSDTVFSRNGNPVSSSTTHFGKSDITGSMTLYTGGTGTTGCNGRGARVLRFDDTDWTYLVDQFVDENNTGTNEGGFGVNDAFMTSNFQAWHWAEYDGLLFSAVVRLDGGARILYTDTGSTLDGAWQYAVGDTATMTDGFGDPNTIGSYLYSKPSIPEAATVMYVGNFEYPNIGDPNGGGDLWKATGPGDDLSWTQITANAFGDENIIQWGAFTEFEGNIYVAGSSVMAASVPGDADTGLSGAKVYRMVSEGTCPDADSDGECDTSDADTVYGTVSGDVLEGINIELYTESCGSNILEATTTTDQYGYYAFGGLTSQRYLVFAEKAGYTLIPGSGWVDIPKAVGQSFDFTATVD
jgi:hypothetical protein